MTSIEREQIAALARKSEALRKAWLQERQEALTEELAANDEVRKRWDKGEPPTQKGGKGQPPKALPQP